MKRISKLFVCVAVIIVVVSVVIVNTFASQTSLNCSTVTFQFYPGSYGGITDYEAKTNASSVYMYVSNAQYDFYACVYGGGKQNVPNNQQGDSYLVSNGYTYYLVNRVYENGYPKCAIQVTAKAQTAQTVTIYWNPDSSVY